MGVQSKDATNGAQKCNYQHFDIKGFLYSLPHNIALIVTIFMNFPTFDREQ